MTKPIQVVISVAVLALLGVGVWWGMGRSNNDNQNANSVVTTNSNTVNSVGNQNVNTSILSGWREYESKKYAFFVSYPSNGLVTSDSIFDPIISVGLDNCFFKYNGEGLGRGISFIVFPDSSVSVGGEQRVKKSYGYEDSKLVSVETILMQDKIAMIELNYPNSTSLTGQCKQILDTMLDTFTFTNIPPADGWVIHQNSEYQFQLAFPPEWSGYTVSVVKDKEFTNYDLQKVKADVITYVHPKTLSSKGNPGKVSFSIEVYKDSTSPAANQNSLGSKNGVYYKISMGNAAAPDEMNDLFNMIYEIRKTFVIL